MLHLPTTLDHLADLKRNTRPTRVPQEYESILVASSEELAILLPGAVEDAALMTGYLLQLFLQLGRVGRAGVVMPQGTLLVADGEHVLAEAQRRRALHA